MISLLNGKKAWLLFVLTSSVILPSVAQRVFVQNIEGINRSYLFYSNTSNYDRNSNRPVIIVLHENGQSARDAFSKAPWKSIKEPTIFIFPNAVNGTWNCKDQSSAASDTKFISAILSDLYVNYHNDRNRIHILANQSAACLAEKLKSENLSISATFNGSDWKRTDSLTVIKDIEKVLKTKVQADTTFNLWEDPLYVKKISPIDSLKGYRLHNRAVLEVRYGTFAMLGSVRTGINDGTYTDFFKSHSFIDIHFTKWMNDSIAWFVDVGRLKVPMKQDPSSDGVIRSGGGMIIPVTVGLKYAFPRLKGRPYLMLGTGVIQAMAFGGKIRPGAMSSGARPNLDAEVRMVFHTTIGTGVDLRFSKRFMVGAHLRYLHSAQFKSAAKVDAIRGFNLNFGLAYIINANSIKKLPFPLTSNK
ncbi:hypothetical protein [Dyadobacter sp. CY356]|uniref:hypothetical protein n=1 Tax=Dyadobacter sp. CY356 TaxID=2906442 RepID=UPI001F3BA495|nr:hypothetical protein [Dyadobacter sp. CY356]MCF0059100.1 hypothetical protein [Dyadobacter sp. CY356]